MLAVIADSASLARTQLADAIGFANEQSIPLQVISTSELDRPDYARNDGSRCFFCKDELFTVMEEFRKSHGYSTPSPTGLTWTTRVISAPVKALRGPTGLPLRCWKQDWGNGKSGNWPAKPGLRIWDKPASACLSSRIEYGRPVTREALSAVEQGEDALRGLGFRQLRVRHHGEIVRIEIAREELPRALNMQMTGEFTRVFKALGFKFVTLDLEGFRSGSMNALLSADQLVRKR